MQSVLELRSFGVRDLSFEARDLGFGKRIIGVGAGNLRFPSLEITVSGLGTYGVRFRNVPVRS